MTSIFKVSIVTPSYNQAPFLEATICSVLEQNYPHIEYIICDGGSTDSSVEIIHKYEKHLAWWCSEKDGGQAAAINKGWQRASGQIWAYLNSDDLLIPDAVHTVVEAFANHPESAIVHGDWLYIDGEGHTIAHVCGKSCNFRKLLYRGQGPYVGQPASFYKAELVRRVGGVDESLHLSMDYDLLLKLALLGSMCYISHPLACLRVHTDAKSFSHTERHWQESFYVQKRYGAKYAAMMRLRYWRYRFLIAMPKPLQLFVRHRRKSVSDRIFLQSENKTGER
jgi:glycosyltransferase involved in cell wall biosynthesis